jgi:tetratricopeptide (TPR) repeat protein
MGLAEPIRRVRHDLPAQGGQPSRKSLRVVSPDDLDPSGGDAAPVSRRLDPGILLEEGLAAAALAMEDYPAVARHCEQICNVCPDHFEAWFNLGYARQQSGEVEEAVAAYQRAAQLSPGDPRPWANLGMARQAVEDLEGAREAYQRALALDLDQQASLWNLGLILERSGSPGEASRLYARLADLRPGLGEAWFRAGYSRSLAGDPEGAVEAYRACLEARPDLSAAALNLAVCLAGLDRAGEARQVLDDLLLAEPDNADALRAVAAVAVDLGDWELCEAVRARLVELGEATPETTFGLGLAFDRTDQQEEAVRYYCEALRENPRFSAALLNLGHLLHRQGKQAEAHECWKRALAMDASLAREYFQPAEIQVGNSQVEDRTA